MSISGGGKDKREDVMTNDHTHCSKLFRMIHTIKQHFYAHDKFMRIRQNGPLDKFMPFLFMCFNILCIVTYGMIIYGYKSMRSVIDSHN